MELLARRRLTSIGNSKSFGVAARIEATGRQNAQPPGSVHQRRHMTSPLLRHSDYVRSVSCLSGYRVGDTDHSSSSTCILDPVSLLQQTVCQSRLTTPSLYFLCLSLATTPPQTHVQNGDWRAIILRAVPSEQVLTLHAIQ